MAAGDIALSILINGNASGAIMAMTQVASSGMSTQAALSTVGLIGAAAIVGLGVAAVKMAGDFQSGLTSLVTGAGETQANLKMVGDGILAISTATGTSTKDLTSAMYSIESSGFHGQAGLTMLQTAAQGAIVGNADLTDVTNVLVTSIHDYGLSANNASGVMNSFIATTSSGNMHMSDLNAALTNVLPTAAKLGIGLNQVEGALATMSLAGDKGAHAGTILNQMFLSLADPASKAAKEITGLGLTTQQIATEMQTSLPGAMQMITDAIGAHFQVGSAAYVAAMATVVGGSKQMKAILDLTGSSMTTFQANVNAAGAALGNNSGQITGWAKEQGDLNVQVARATAGINAFMTTLGHGLLPIVTPIVGGIADMVGGLTKFSSTSAGITTVVITLGAALAGSLLLAAGGLKAAFTGAITSLLGTAAATTDEAAASSVAAASADILATAMKAVAVSTTAMAAAMGIDTDTLVAGAAAFDAAAAAATTDAVATTAAVAPTLALGAALWAALAPILPFVIAIVGLAAGFILLYNNSTGFRDMINEIGPKLQELGQDVLTILQPAFKALADCWNNELVPAMKAFWNAIQPLAPVLKDLAPVLKDLGYLVLAFVVGLGGILAGAIIIVVYAVTGLVEIFTLLVEGLGAAATAIGKFAAAFADWSTGAVNSVNQFVSSALGAMGTFFANCANFLSNFGSETYDAFLSALGAVGDFFTGFANMLDTGVSDVNKFLNSIGPTIGNFFSQLGTKAHDWGANLIKNLIAGIESQFSGITQAVAHIALTIQDYIGFASPTRLGPGSTANLWMPALVSMLSSGLAAGVPQIQSASSKLAGGIGSAFSLSGNNNAFALPSPGSGSANGQGTYNFTVELDGKTIASAVEKPLARNVRIKGGYHGA